MRGSVVVILAGFSMTWSWLCFSGSRSMWSAKPFLPRRYEDREEDNAGRFRPQIAPIFTDWEKSEYG